MWWEDEQGKGGEIGMGVDWMKVTGKWMQGMTKRRHSGGKETEMFEEKVDDAVVREMWVWRGYPPSPNLYVHQQQDRGVFGCSIWMACWAGGGAAQTSGGCLKETST